MLFLLEETIDHKYHLYSPETYSMDTWGMSSQDTLRKHDNNKWYQEYWSDGGRWGNDIKEEYELNIVLETSNIDEVISFILKHNESQVVEIIDQLKEEINTWLDFEKEFRSE